MISKSSSFLCIFFLAIVQSKIYFKEDFSNVDRWVYSTLGDNNGKFKLENNKFTQDESDFELSTSEDARFYRYSAKFDEPINTKAKDLIIHYSVAHPQDLDCGGGYLKIMPSETDLEQVNGDTNYGIMFGPDICGSATKKVHFIINYKGKNHLIQREITSPHDLFTHTFTLVLSPSHTYKVLIDGELQQEGSIEDDFDLLPAKTMKDPSISKAADWVDIQSIADPTDEKPIDWDQPEKIPDPEATKPDDWDDDDPEWEPPMIENVNYKGEWKAKMIDNPEYKGEWVHPMIDNPDYLFDDSIATFDDLGAVSIEIWQVKSGSRFDNILISDDEIDAEDFIALANDRRAAEKKIDEEQRAKEAEKAKEESPKVEEPEFDTDDDMDEKDMTDEELEEMEKDEL